jgi:ribosomal protein S18 acetylase RimI-like enzyme
MEVTSFLEEDIAPFLAMAQEEGWICDLWEFLFLLKNFPEGCFVYREGERALGYITSVKYGKSGWIGNLLVDPQARSRGIGRALKEQTVATLLKHGVETVWLTASEKGAGLYQKLGFMPIDSIFRWIGKGTAEKPQNPVEMDLESLRVVDGAGWGDRRDSLLEVTCRRGRIYSSPGGYICCQPWQNGLQIGPWGCLIPPQAEQLLDQALSGAGKKVFLDVPAGNQTAIALLLEKGFEVKGSSTLMYLGADPSYQADKVFALASMGSMG